jgi:hypothetical protein
MKKEALANMFLCRTQKLNLDSASMKKEALANMFLCRTQKLNLDSASMKKEALANMFLCRTRVDGVKDDEKRKISPFSKLHRLNSKLLGYRRRVVTLRRRILRVGVVRRVLWRRQLHPVILQHDQYRSLPGHKRDG